MKAMILPTVAAAIAVSFLSPAQAQTTVKADFAMTSSTNVTTKASNITSATFNSSKVDAYIGDDGFGNVLEQYANTGGTSASGAYSSNSYVSYTLRAVTGQTLGINSISFDVGKGGNAGDPRGFFIRSSLDNFTSDIFSEVLPAGNASAPLATIVSLGTAFESLTNVTFRIYDYTAAPKGGTSYSVDFKNVSFNSVAAAAPEPGTWMMMILGFGLVGGVLRSANRKPEERFAR